jgi:hypothetical protein
VLMSMSLVSHAEYAGAIGARSETLSICLAQAGETPHLNRDRLTLPGIRTYLPISHRLASYTAAYEGLGT